MQTAFPLHDAIKLEINNKTLAKSNPCLKTKTHTFK